MVPRSIIHRVTAPLVVHEFNHAYLTERMGRGEVPFVQRAGENQRMRSIHGRMGHPHATAAADMWATRPQESITWLSRIASCALEIVS